MQGPLVLWLPLCELRKSSSMTDEADHSRRPWRWLTSRWIVWNSTLCSVISMVCQQHALLTASLFFPQRPRAMETLTMVSSVYCLCSPSCCITSESHRPLVSCWKHQFLFHLVLCWPIIDCCLLLLVVVLLRLLVLFRLTTLWLRFEFWLFVL